MSGGTTATITLGVMAALLTMIAILVLCCRSCSTTAQPHAANVRLAFSREPAWPLRPLRDHRMRAQVQAKRNSVPKRIFQTWHDAVLPPKMKLATLTLQAAHPDFEYVLMSDAQAQRFLGEYYDVDVVEAYNTLIPGAYKADLWRLCVLYALGGCYLDIKYVPQKSFSLHRLLDGPHFVRDRGNYGIYNALMVCPAGDERLLNAIEQIVKNVQTRYYGKNALAITGPTLLKDFIDCSGPDVDLKFGCVRTDGDYICKRKSMFNKALLHCYKGYRAEQRQNQNAPHYSTLWKEKSVYA